MGGESKQSLSFQTCPGGRVSKKNEFSNVCKEGVESFQTKNEFSIVFRGTREFQTKLELSNVSRGRRREFSNKV